MIRIEDSSHTEYGTIVNKVYSDRCRFSVDGKLGGSVDTIVYLYNDDPTRYYINLSVAPMSSNYDDIAGEWGETGFGIKVLQGERRPTETEWDQVRSGESINLEDLGNTESADITNRIPIWIRAICPGLTPAQIKTNTLIRVSYEERVLGT